MQSTADFQGEGWKELKTKLESAFLRKGRKGAETVQALVFGRNKLPPEERAFMEANGDAVINSITVWRKPINQVPVDKILNAISFGGFNRLMKEYAYDRLFHLYMICNTNKGRIIVEKNDVINIEKSSESGGESISIPMTNEITLNELISKTARQMGSRFTPYNAFLNNCQVFISSILKANGLSTAENDRFILQKVDELIDKLPFADKIKKVVNIATDLGEKVDILKQGVGMIQGGRIQRGDKVILFQGGMRRVDIPDKKPTSIDDMIEDIRALLKKLKKKNPASWLIYKDQFKDELRRNPNATEWAEFLDEIEKELDNY